MTPIAPTTEAFFTDRLAGQRKASPHTITAYRDSLKLLLGFASRHAGKPASRLAFTGSLPNVANSGSSQVEPCFGMSRSGRRLCR